MARSNLNDPLDKFRWVVDIDGFTRFGFVSCSTPEYSITSTKYQEGGAHLNPRSIVNSVDYKPVELTRGVTNDTSFNKWATSFIDMVQNNGATQSTSSVDSPIMGALASAANVAGFLGPTPVASYKPGRNYRRDVKIKHVNRVGQVIVQYTLYNAYPIAYKPASDFNAHDDEGFSIESITLDYEGFDVTYTGIAGALTSLGAGALKTLK